MIYISTGGFGKKSGYNLVKILLNHGIKNIELSGGLHQKKHLESLKRIKGVNFKIHNYFPPPEKPFVFNLASEDPDIIKLSIQHAKTAMRWALELDTPMYSFHAGFLMDPDVSQLGKKIFRKNLFNRKHAIVSFIERVNDLDDYAKNLGVSLLIENNVLSKNNYIEFGDNPFLMATSHECKEVMNNTSSNVNLLVDVAHLKVSSNSLSFDPVQFLKDCNNWIKAYHFSDNNGEKDSNEIVKDDSWFWPYIKKDLDYYTLEVYEEDINILLEQLRTTKKCIAND